MDADLKQLHYAVRILLKARVSLRLATKKRRRTGSFSSHDWFRVEYLEQLELAIDNAHSRLLIAEADVLLHWDNLAYCPPVESEGVGSR